MLRRLQRVRASRAGCLSALLMALAMVVVACGGDTDDTADTDAAAGDSGDDGSMNEEAAGSEEIVWEDGVLQPLASGFPERPITLVVVDDPGTRDALYAADMADAVADISPVDVVVSHEPHPQGGTLPTLAELTERDGGTEGYYPEVTTLVGTPTDLHIEPIEQDWGVGMDDVQFVIATEELPYVMVQRADAEWGDTFDDFVEYAQNNPGELRYISAGVGSGHDISMSWMINSLGLEVEKVPAQGHQEALSAIGAGEGDFTMTRAGLARQNEEAGRVKAIFTMSDGVPAPWSEEDGVKSRVDYDEYGLDNVAWGIILGYMVPAETPDSNVQWLYEFFKAGFETEGWPERADTNPGLNLYDEPLTPSESQELAQTVYEFSEPIVRDVGLHWEDNQ